ncbi:uncharacterized protein BN503_01437 [Oscillibacter sp. CAG:155]|nr:uncharacterized protein BN503_01437 [Oscillibacter sp. CAG:155]
MGLGDAVGIVLELLVECDDVQHVQELALILVETLDLHVEDGGGVQHHALALFRVGGEALLVVLLDLGQALQHRLVVGVGVQLFQGRGMEQILVPAGEVPDQAVQLRVDLAEPSAVVDTVGDVLELPGLHGAGVLENVLAQDLGVEGADAVDRHTAGHAQVRHPDLATPDDGHFLRLLGIVEEVLHFLLPAGGDLLGDLPDPGQEVLKEVLRPALQRLRQHRVVGVGHRLGGDVPRLIPIHAGIIDEDPHQLRDHQSRMGVVDLDDVLLVEVLQCAVDLQVLGCDGLHRGGDEEVLLLEPQGLALQVVILGIEDLGDGLCHCLLLGSLQILAPGEQRHIQRLGGTGVPQPQHVHMVCTVAGDLHVAGHCPDHRSVLVDHMQMAVVPELPDGAAEADLLGLLGLGEQPGGAQALPVVGQLHLLALHDLLLEDAQLIADGIAGGRDLQRGHGIQIAGSQTAQTAVAQCCVRLQLENVRGLEAHLLQCLPQLGQDLQVVGVFHQAAAHQKLQRQVVYLLFLFPAGPGAGLHLPQGHHVPDHQGAGLHHLLIGGFLRPLAEVEHQLGGEGLFQFFCGKCCHEPSLLRSLLLVRSCGPVLRGCLFLYRRCFGRLG